MIDQKNSLSKQEYSQLFEKGKWYSTPLLSCRFLKADTNKIGWIIPKKKVKRAVDRNTLKRIFREQFRKEKENFSGIHFLISIRYPLKYFERSEFHQQAAQCLKQCPKRLEK